MSWSAGESSASPVSRKRTHSPIKAEACSAKKVKVENVEAATSATRKGRGRGAARGRGRGAARGRGRGTVKLEPIDDEKPGCSMPEKSSNDDDEDNDCVMIDMEWEFETVLADSQNIPVGVAKNLKKLFDEDNTIPFIARYRKEMTENMGPEKLREVKENLDMLKHVRKRASTVLGNITKMGKITQDLRKSILSSKDLTQIEHLYAPFKGSAKTTLADRARKLGMEPIAMDVMNHSRSVNLYTVIDPNVEGKATLEEVKVSIQHIISDIINKDKDVLEHVRHLMKDRRIKLESTKSKTARQEDAKDSSDKKFYKFELYYDFSYYVWSLKPHQILAINRGENVKALSVRIILPEALSLEFNRFCYNKWCTGCHVTSTGNDFISASIHDAYKRLIQPFIVRQIRSQLTLAAQKASVDVFSANLKKLLLTAPIRGKVVIGIDPGFKNGCKLAVVSANGEVLETGVIYPHKMSLKNNPLEERDSHRLKEMMLNHCCSTVALGNGTACRETELYLTHLIQVQFFHDLDVAYTIVSEQGASIYSCSKEAQEEFPDWDQNVISAVSIARRLQDPLLEYVKIEPKHLGVGMYQHDVPEKKLKLALDDVVSECVSFVGVDLNVASEYMLRRVAGLNSAKAKSIIAWRTENGPFVSRQQLSKLRGIGPKTFQQCAGFVRILPETSKNSVVKTLIKTEIKDEKKKKKTANTTDTLEPLDRTCIHPESYQYAKRLISEFQGKEEEIGAQSFIQAVRIFMRTSSVSVLAEKYNIGEPTVQLIVDGLQQTLDYDMRAEFDKPLFRKEVMRMEDLKPGMLLTGKVTNVTHFGAFVDIGVGKSGLIHVSKMRGKQIQLGNRVKVEVERLDIAKGRIGLLLREIESVN